VFLNGKMYTIFRGKFLPEIVSTVYLPKKFACVFLKNRLGIIPHRLSFVGLKWPLQNFLKPPWPGPAQIIGTLAPGPGPGKALIMTIDCIMKSYFHLLCQVDPSFF
jgi:hypothetical protein